MVSNSGDTRSLQNHPSPSLPASPARLARNRTSMTCEAAWVMEIT